MATKLASGYVDLTVHFDEALKQVRRAFNELDDAEIDVDANTSGATQNVGRWRTKEEANPVNVRVDVDTKMASTQVRGLRRDLESLGRSDFLKINLGVAGIASLPALASGIAEVASAMQQLSQAALVVPGGIAGAVSSVGTLAFGLTGVTDAYEALNKAADDNAKSGRDAANQARSQQSASYSLRNAIVDEEQARNDVNRAIRNQKRELQDLALEQRGGVVSEKRAVLDAQKARERLYSGDFSDYREALLDVEEADLRIEEVRNRNVRTTEDLAEANAKGVANSDRVVSANERLVRSQQGVVSAQGAVAAAAATTSAAQEDADLAMSKLAPNAQEFVRALMDVQGPIQSLRNLVQNRIFDGLAGELKGLTDAAMPTFERGLGGIGDAWNKTFKQVAKVAGDKKNLGILDRIFGNTADAQNILTGAIDPLTDGLLTLTEAGTDALPRLADGFVSVSERFADFITEADADGRLAEWIDEGITAMGHLGEIVLNVGKMFTGIGDAADGNLLENLEKWTTKWAAWINSVEGQETLKNFFAEGKRVLEQWRPILEDVPGIFSRIYDAVSTFASGMSQVLSPVTEILKDFPGLVETAVIAFLAFNSARTIGAIAALMGNLTGLSTMLKTTLPASAAIGATGVSAALSRIALPLWLSTLIEDKYPNFPMQDQPDGEDRIFPGWVPILPFWEDRIRDWQDGGDDGTGTGAAQQAGKNALDTDFLLNGGSARDYAHQQKLPYWENKGFTVGDHQADWAGEHQNGALDIMVPSIEEGNKVLQEVLADPNVYGAIFNNQSYGYGNGLTPKDYGSTGGPTDRHEDHVHVWYKPGDEGNIVPPQPQVAPPAPAPAPGPPPAGAPSSSPLEDLLRGGLRTYDTGGWWPNGQLGVNTTGKDELVLNPDHLDQLAKQGVDPNTLLHGQGQGAFPGPPPELLDQVAAQTGVKPDEAFSGARTGGYIPAAAGSTSVAGESFLSGIYGMGAQVINGLIDQAASAAAGAAGAAATVFAPGSGGAASGLASAAIGMGTQAAKRGVEYGAQMLGIFTDSIIEQATPFGAPRLLTTDPTGFMPQQMLSGMAAKMIMPGQQPPGQPGQAPGGPPPVPHQGTNAAPGPTPPPLPGPPPGPPPGVGQAAGQSTPTDLAALDFLKPLGIYDDGGWLPPGGLAMNLGQKAEPLPVFNHDQWGTLNAIANSPVSELSPSTGGNDYRTIIESVTVKDVNELERQLEDRRRLNTMRYRGRPG
jgi:hypothetical protein